MIADVPYEWPRWLTRLFSRKPKTEPVETQLMWIPVSDLERQVFAAMILAGRPVTNAELARLMGCSPGESSKRAKALLGVIRKERIGREVRLSLPHYHYH